MTDTGSEAYRLECFNRWQLARQQAIKIMLELIRRVGIDDAAIVAEYKSNFRNAADTAHLNQLLDELKKNGSKTKWLKPKNL